MGVDRGEGLFQRASSDFTVDPKLIPYRNKPYFAPATRFSGGAKIRFIPLSPAGGAFGSDLGLDSWQSILSMSDRA